MRASPVVIASVFVIPQSTARLSDRNAAMGQSQLLLRRDPSESGPLRPSLRSGEDEWFSAELSGADAVGVGAWGGEVIEWGIRLHFLFCLSFVK